MSSVDFMIDRNPYDDDVPLYKKTKVTINSGLTVLVGCNGAGKSTLLRSLKNQLKDRKDVLVLDYNDRKDGGNKRINDLMTFGYTEEAATMVFSSEGERIVQSFRFFCSKLGSSIRKSRPKEAWVLMDAVGSGLSIDNVLKIKDFIKFVENEEKNIDFFFVVSANEYEFASGEDCIDAINLTHKEFKTYNAYRKFILKSEQAKGKRFKEQGE